MEGEQVPEIAIWIPIDQGPTRCQDLLGHVQGRFRLGLAAEPRCGEIGGLDAGRPPLLREEIGEGEVLAIQACLAILIEVVAEAEAGMEEVESD